jgi:hypothetical protein
MGATIRARHDITAASHARNADRPAPHPSSPCRATCTGDPSGHTDRALHRRQVAHDIRHELATIMLLASTLMASKDLGNENRLRAEQLLMEARALSELLQENDHPSPSNPDLDESNPSGALQLDELTTDVVSSLEIPNSMQISLDTQPIAVDIDWLSLWHLLQNIICYEVEAAGPGSQLTVRVKGIDGFAVVDVSDDTPGRGAREFEARDDPCIANEIAASCGAVVELGLTATGGRALRLLLPQSNTAERAGQVAHARRNL